MYSGGSKALYRFKRGISRGWLKGTNAPYPTSPADGVP